MTEQTYSENARKVLQYKKQIQTALKVKLAIKGNYVQIDGSPENEIITRDIVEAIDMGFSIEQALDLKNEEFTFQKIPIKSISKRHDLSQVRARVIGRERGVLQNIEFLTNCDIVLHDNSVGIIGHNEDVKKAAYAMRKLIAGSKHANVYMYLEDENAKQKAGVW